MITWAKAYRLRETFTAVVVLCPLIVWFGGRTMQLSALTPIATTWFLSLGLIVVSALPLSDSFALLEATFAPSRLLRTIRAAVVAICVGAGAACLVATTTAPGIVAWLFLLAAVTVLATMALGPQALFMTLAVGGGGVDHRGALGHQRSSLHCRHRHRHTPRSRTLRELSSAFRDDPWAADDVPSRAGRPMNPSPPEPLTA